MKHANIEMIEGVEPSLDELEEKLWLLKRDEHRLRSDVRNKRDYSANPDNTFHDVYQMAINRRFCFTVTLLSLLRAVFTYGISQTFMFIFASVVFCVFFAVLLYIVLSATVEVFDLISNTIDYLNGE